jgi:nucleotide-binding universal stress UspA family protein
MKVLIGVDESAEADRAIEFVKKMTWPAGTRMIVASAVQVPMVAYSEAYVPATVDVTGWLGELTKIHRELAATQAGKLTAAGFTVESRVLDGDPRVALLDEALKEGVDLLVVGSHGRTGIGKLVMGSVASHIVTHAPCNVLVVRAKARA